MYGRRRYSRYRRRGGYRSRFSRRGFSRFRRGRGLLRRRRMYIAGQRF